MLQRVFEQLARSHDIGLHKRCRAINRSIDMRLCGKIDDCLRAEFKPSNRAYQGTVGDITFHKHVARVARRPAPASRDCRRR